MKSKTIGGIPIGLIGLGCMGMSHAYGRSNEHDNLQLLEQSLELGCNHWDTSDFYGFGENEKLLAKVLKNKRERVFIASKTGIEFDKDISLLQMKDRNSFGINNSAEYIIKHVNDSLTRLGVEQIDLYYLHRMDPKTPIEKTVDVMASLVKSGKIKNIGLCEVDAGILRRAHSIHPITALQMEYSIWSRGIEKSVLPTCHELGVNLIAYAPLGRGFLSGKFNDIANIDKSDIRLHFPRFDSINGEKNIEIVHVIQKIADKHQATLAQVAIAWILAKSNFIFPIPGTKNINYLRENIAASELTLSPEDMESLDSIQVYGARYPSMLSNNILND
ncbi:aldo/keto reductase [Serratia sp. (in: enterobacteria)]|uniref:aldo/keto reductase n=1 Tax=Serratia sp. (in: enterobacteria) TaxID=616 RepID=UPI003988B992